MILGIIIFAIVVSSAIVNRALKLMREDQTRAITQQHVRLGLPNARLLPQDIMEDK